MIMIDPLDLKIGLLMWWEDLGRLLRWLRK